jgi:two-component system CheB/CheR fusion protein
MSQNKGDDPSTQSEPSILPPEIVVGIGASAGGLEALEHVFNGMPSETGMAFDDYLED